MSMSLNPLWEEVTPQCASSKWKGTLSQCYSSPTVWVALGTAVVDPLCVARSYRLRKAGCNDRMPISIGSFSYTLSGEIPIRRSSEVTSPFPPSGNEGYIRNRDVPSALFSLFPQPQTLLEVMTTNPQT